MSKLTEKEFKKIYWKNFLSIEEEFIQTEKYVAFDTKNYTTYSTAFLKLLLEIGSEIDILAKVLCTEQWNKPNVSKILNYRDCILANAPEFERVYVVSDFGKEIPWHDWRQKTPEWWTAYNKVKHDRFGIGTIGKTTQEYYKFANQGYVLKALMALYQLEIYILNFLVKQEEKEEACSYLKSTLFSLDGEGWTSSNFHKYGDPFYKNGEICFENMVSIK